MIQKEVMMIKNKWIIFYACITSCLTLHSMEQPKYPKMEIVKFPVNSLSIDYALRGSFSLDGSQFSFGDSDGHVLYGETNLLSVSNLKVKYLNQSLDGGIDVICFDRQQDKVGVLSYNNDDPSSYIQFMVQDIAGSLNYKKSIVKNDDSDLSTSDLVVMDNFVVYFQGNDLFIYDLRNFDMQPVIIRESVLFQCDNSVERYGKINKLRAIDDHKLLVLADQMLILIDISTQAPLLWVSLNQLGYKQADGFELYIVDAEYLPDGRLIVSTNVDVSMFCYNLHRDHWTKLSTLCSFQDQRLVNLRKHYNSDRLLAFGVEDDLRLDVDGTKSDCLYIWFDIWPFKRTDEIFLAPSQLDYVTFKFGQNIRILDACWTLDESILVLCVDNRGAYFIRIVLNDTIDNLLGTLANREVTGKRLQLHGKGTSYLSLGKRYNKQTFFIEIPD
jgi:hypothetical protein